jgi:hypothetical protein
MKRLLTGMSLRVDLSPRRRVLPSGLEAGPEAGEAILLVRIGGVSFCTG